jgi:SAM-dependent methyltransferase
MTRTPLASRRPIWLADLLPPAPALIVDVGAGTGRDAAAFAAAGYEVVAIEPSAGMRAEAARLHPSPRIRWESDSLPALLATARLGIAADVVSLSADPARDVSFPRARALELMAEGRIIRCVWSGKRLTTESLDIDHCFPWSAWPCGDLWNLMPADRRVNQISKRGRLPSAEALGAAGDGIAAWWTAAYLRPDDPILPARFIAEATASLPGLPFASNPPPTEVYAALSLQRIRLRQNQGVPEWSWRD